MPNRPTRRHFLASAGALASATLFGSRLLNPTSVSGAMLVVRRDVGTMTAEDPILDSYRRAIQAMQALPSTNPLSWAYQAAIHWTLATPSPLPTAWDTCEHNTDFFWSWHRMYLYWFERIIRKMSGDACWALPYWNWAPGSEWKLPAPFRDTSSVLYTSNRDPNMNSGSGSLNPLGIDISSAFAATNFLSANNIIQGPHGSVHVQVGGWMASVPTAAQDPIFYLHHSNVDRLWNLWLAQGGGRSDPLGNSAWTSRKYTFFDENGSAVQMDACQILRAALQLNYVYECEPAQVTSYCRPHLPPIPWWEFTRELLWRLPIPPVELTSQVVSFPIELKELRAKISPLVERTDETLYLELDDVEAEKNPGVSWAVFLGLPEGKQPERGDPAYLGSLSMFGAGIRSETHHEFKPAHFEYPVNRALQAALRANSDRVPVTFVPVGILVDGKPTRLEVKSPVRIGKASLTRETRKEHKE